MLATPLETATLPPGIRSRFVRGVNGLDIHILEAGYAPAGRPLVLLLHGFPEIAYSWRKVMPALAEAGFHAVAPDQRGYGRTTGWDTVRFTPSSATISAPGSPRGVRWFGPTCSARWR
jgi:pimeloyl-ACP methyl ester carboxylesterase